MKVVLAVVGRAGKSFADAIDDYENRAKRYWPLEVVEVKATKAGGGRTDQDVKDAEGQFAKKQHGGDASGVASARASVVTGTEDATFDTDPDGKDKGRDRPRGD